MDNIKKKHHFVSQFYLREWANIKHEIFAFDGKKTFKPSIDTSIGFKKNLYRGVQFSEKQRLLIDDYCIKVGYEKLSSYYLLIKSIFDTQRYFDLGDHLLACLDKDLKSEEIEKLKDTFKSNILEDSFSESESKFKNVLEKIIKNQNNILNLNDYDVLIHFICFQLIRTPKKLNRMRDGTKDDFIEKFGFDVNQLEFFNLLMGLCISEQIYLSALSRLDLITIFYNETGLNFITSDDPSFNQKFLEKELFIQIPITPKIMLQLSKNYESLENRKNYINYLNSYKKQADSIQMLNKTIFIDYIYKKEEVQNINQIIFDNRERCIFGLSEDDFKDIRL